MSSRTPVRSGVAGAADSRAIDQASRRAIREDLLTNILVEAGAGSGKTQMLAERMAAGVATGAYRVERIAAVTFTRKAASELRGRFHLALEKRLASGELPHEEAARVRAALSSLERFFAGTIHAFCARLLRERPVEAGVSPGFTELDEAQDLELRRRAWRDFISAARAAGDPDMLALLDAGVRPADLDPAFAIVSAHEDVAFPPGTAECPDPGPAWTALEAFWKAIRKLLPDPVDPGTTCKIQQAALAYEGLLGVSRRRTGRPSVVAELLDTWDCDSKITLYQWSSDKAAQQRIKAQINDLHGGFKTSVVEPWLAEWRRYVYRLSVGLLCRARSVAAAERRRLNALNYGDLLNLTAGVLRTNPQVRRALQRRYRHLFVDEFQDTDPIQAEIVFLLAADEGDEREAGAAHRDSVIQRKAGSGKREAENERKAGSGKREAANERAAGSGKREAENERKAGSGKRKADWRSLPLRPGSLFVVGDPKQSIYRFRRADIEIYNIVRDRFSEPATGRVVALTMNFRSVPALCAWANEVFAEQFPAEPTQHSPRFAALDPKEEAAPAAGPAVFTIPHTGDAKAVVAADAARIAAYIRSEVDAGRRRFSDFLVLTRKKKVVGTYAQALERLNIAVEASGAGAFGESEEVRALIVLLRALADPQDALSLVAVLRGPFFGLSDRELFAFKQAGGSYSIFAGSHDPATLPAGVVADPGDATAKVGSSITTLRQFHRWTRVMPAGAAHERILERSGYLAMASTTPGGVEAGDLLHAIDRVRRVVQDGGSLADAADALESDGDDSTEVESLPLEPGRGDVVRVMNLHKAKGLEADVVFLADPCGGFNQKVDVHIQRGAGGAEGWFRVVRKNTKSRGETVLGEHADWAAHERAELPYLQAEESRLLYVAATRARHVLVISRSDSKRTTPAWGALNRFLEGVPELPIPASVRAETPEPDVLSDSAQLAAHAARNAAQAAVTPPSWSITSVTAEAKHIAKIAAAADPPAEPDDVTRVVGRDTPTHRADAGMAWGTLIHGLLEHAMRHRDATRDDLRRLAMWLTVEEPELRTVLDEALDTVERVSKAEFWAEAQSRTHFVETPFTVAEAYRLTNGVIDLLFESEAGWQVVDYKTDRTLADGRYGAQLEAYRSALRQVGCRVVGASLVNVRTKPA